MMDTNESNSDGADNSDEIDPSDWIRTVSTGVLSADVLFDLREEFRAIGAQNIATRVEIERRRALNGSDVMLTGDELKGLGVSLTSAKQLRQRQGRTDRIDVIESIAVGLDEEFGLEDEAVVAVETDDGSVHSIFDVVSGEAGVDVSVEGSGPGQ